MKNLHYPVRKLKDEYSNKINLNQDSCENIRFIFSSV